MTDTNTKQANTFKEEYKEYTMGLALFDALPVLIFLMSGIVIYTMFDSPVFLTGAIACFVGGMSKVIWKMIVVLRKRDCPVLTKAFRILMFGGFGLMILSVLLRAGQGSLKGLWHAVTMMPACIFFVIGILGMCLMGYFGSHMDSSAKSNWKEEAVNTVAQTAVLIGVILVYFGTYYHATDAAAATLESTPAVAVSETEEYYLFDGPGEENAVIFYQGAKVAPEAYAPLMMRLANDGTDCFLCKMPANFAFFGKDMAEDIREDFASAEKTDSESVENTDSESAEKTAAGQYENWFLAGHSLGGVVASSLAAEDAEDADEAQDETDEKDAAPDWSGVIFLASYPTEKMPVPVLSIYGSEDEVLNQDRYSETAENGLWPDDFTEIVIKGGNHAQFGSYGAQKGDGTASIPEKSQIEKTAAAITKWINAH